jgi:hypothetical protein
MTDVATFGEIEPDFVARAHAMVWCSLATVDRRGRPRSRVIHPVWEVSTGWIGTRPDSFKAKHLAANPYVSLAYVANVAKPVYVDCLAEWVDDRATRERVWDFFVHAPAPVGYDPAPIFGDLDGFGLLRLTPWRVELVDAPRQSRVWRAPV